MTHRFSSHFALGRSQAELDFVDIPLETDIRLFVDPYALSVASDTWLLECNDIVVGYFELLLESIRNGDEARGLALLSHLREPNDTHLGLSKGRPSGRGVGPDQARDLYDALKKSKAVKTGFLEDLTDCELHVPNISSDKISDMTINIIRCQLLDYTERQCQNLGIPTENVSSGMYWDPERLEWANRYVQLPVYEDERILLIPKAAVRFRMAADHQEYYKRHVLEFLQAEHLHAGTALVRVLKNGRRRVTKKDLMERYPLSKDYLAEFSKDHPEVFSAYKEGLRAKSRTIHDEEIEDVQQEPRPIEVGKLIIDLENIPPGKESAASFHNFIIGALEAIFFPQLRKPIKEQELFDGRKRVDIVFNNGADTGFFGDLRTKHGVHCPYVFFECKNYSADLKNPEFDQLTGRFSDKRGMFGILVCRTNKNVDLIQQRCKDIVNANRGYVLVLDDSDIKTLLHFRSQENYTAISDYLDEKFRRLVF